MERGSGGEDHATAATTPGASLPGGFSSACDLNGPYPPGSLYYQGGSGAIGSEISDPIAGYVRYSDASKNLINVDSAGPVTVGLIAHTNAHSKTLVDPPLYVTNYADPPLQGQIVQKVGYKTGTTSATVTDACLNINTGHNFYLLCQVKAWAVQSDTVTEGDSGSPIFQNVEDSTVALTGMLWGHDHNHPEKWWFSPLNGIRTDLGDFSAAAWWQPTATLSGPSSVAPGTYTWIAYPAGGNGSYTYQWEYKNAGSSTWTSLGTGQSQDRTITGSTPAFTMKVTVTSGGYTRSRSMDVTVYPALTGVDLSGPDWVHPGQVCHWTAVPTGGSPPYTYDWDGGGDGTDTYGVYVLESFSVGVTVTDANGSQAYNGLYVYVDDGGPGC